MPNSSRKLAWVMGILLHRPYIWWVPPIEVPEMAMDMSHFSQTMHVLKSTMCNDVYVGCRCLSSSSNCPSKAHFLHAKAQPWSFLFGFPQRGRRPGCQVRIVDQVHSSPQGTNKTWMECYVYTVYIYIYIYICVCVWVCYMLYSQFCCYCYYRCYWHDH